jgi:hypothetical protein
MDRGGFDQLMGMLHTDAHNWIADEYKLRHTSGISIWIGNGFLSYGLYQPTKSRFTVRQKLRFARVFKRWQGWWVPYLFEMHQLKQLEEE